MVALAAEVYNEALVGSKIAGVGPDRCHRPAKILLGRFDVLAERATRAKLLVGSF